MQNESRGNTNKLQCYQRYKKTLKPTMVNKLQNSKYEWWADVKTQLIKN